MLTVKTNGQIIKRVKAYEIESTLDAVADAFSFIIGNPAGINAGKIIEGKEVEIVYDGTPVMIGEIDDVEEGHEIQVKGRDLMIRAIENDVHHREEERTVRPDKEIIRLAKKIGLENIDTSGLPDQLAAIEEFTLEAGESFAEVMLKLADKGGFYLWLDRFGTLYLSRYDFEQSPQWHFYDRRNGANCESIIRHRSAANLKAKLWAYSDEVDGSPVTHEDQALLRAGFSRIRTMLDTDSYSTAAAKRKLEKLMADLKWRGKAWEVRYGNDHRLDGAIPEPGLVAAVTSVYSGVENLRTLVAGVTLKLDENGTSTTVVLREQP